GPQPGDHRGHRPRAGERRGQDVAGARRATQDSAGARDLCREVGNAHLAVGRRTAPRARDPVELLVRPGDPEAQGLRGPRSDATMTEYREADLSRLKTVPVSKRPNKVDASLLGRPPLRTDRSFTTFLDSLPSILAAQDLRYVVDQIVAATGRRAIVTMLGGHVIKVGLGASAELGVPVTVHAAIGAEIIHQHPSADGAAIGETSHRDFKRLAGVLPDLDDGGVVLNLGSAVVMPEVFLKALTIARNLNGGKPKGFTACDCDMQRHYRPRVNVVERPTLAGGRGVQLTGHHEILIPLLCWAVLQQL